MVTRCQAWPLGRIEIPNRRRDGCRDARTSLYRIVLPSWLPTPRFTVGALLISGEPARAGCSRDIAALNASLGPAPPRRRRSPRGARTPRRMPGRWPPALPLPSPPSRHRRRRKMTTAAQSPTRVTPASRPSQAARCSGIPAASSSSPPRMGTQNASPMATATAFQASNAASQAAAGQAGSRALRSSAIPSTVITATGALTTAAAQRGPPPPR